VRSDFRHYSRDPIREEREFLQAIGSEGGAEKNVPAAFPLSEQLIIIIIIIIDNPNPGLAEESKAARRKSATAAAAARGTSAERSMDQFPKGFDGGCHHGRRGTHHRCPCGESQAAAPNTGQQHGGHKWQASALQGFDGLHCADCQR